MELQGAMNLVVQPGADGSVMALTIDNPTSTDDPADAPIEVNGMLGSAVYLVGQTWMLRTTVVG